MKLRKLYEELRRTDWSDAKDLDHGLRCCSEKIMDFFGEDRDIRTITYKDLSAYVQYSKEQGNSGATINRRLSVISKMFTVARRHDPRITRPEIPRQKAAGPRTRILSDAEVDALVAYEWKRPEYHALTVLLTDTGCRPSELLSGKYKVKGDELWFFDTKNDDHRFVILTERAQAALKVLEKNHVVYATYWVHFSEAVEACGMGDDVTPYILRHTALTRLAERGTNPLLIQKWAGHKNLATTQRYVKQTRAGMEKLAEIMRRN